MCGHSGNLNLSRPAGAQIRLSRHTDLRGGTLNAVQVQLPCNSFRHVLPGHLRRGRLHVVTKNADTERFRVSAIGLSALRGPRQTTSAPFPDPAILVDNQVVANVAPAEGTCMVLVNDANLSWHLGFRVVVVPRRVVHYSTPDRYGFTLPLHP